MIASPTADQGIGLALVHRLPVMPDLLGTPSRGPWQGEGDFSLAEEAERIVRALTRLRPLTHKREAAGLIADHIARAEATRGRAVRQVGATPIRRG